MSRLSQSLKAGIGLIAAVALLTACSSAGPDDPAGPGAAGDWEPTWVDGKLEPLGDGFPGEPLVLVSRGDPGSRNGILMRQLFQTVQELAPVPVRLEDAPLTGLGSWEELDQLNQVDSEGYRLMIVALAGSAADSLVEPVHDLFDLTIDDYNPVIRMETQPYVIVQKKNAPWGPTFEDMVQYGLENPGELRYISNQVGSGHDILMEKVLNDFGVEVNKIPAGSQGDAITAVGAGEGDFTSTSVDLALQHWEADRVDVTLVTGDTVPEPWDTDSNVVDSASGISDPLWSIDLSLLAASETPEQHREWLFELFSAAAEDPEYVSQREQLPGVSVSVLDHDGAMEIVDRFLAEIEPIIRELGMHWEDK